MSYYSVSGVETCMRKVAHHTYKDAYNAAERLFRETGEIVYPYECQICRNFHNGHDRERQVSSSVAGSVVERIEQAASARAEKARRREQDLQRQAADVRSRAEREAKKRADGARRHEENNRRQAEESERIRAEKARRHAELTAAQQAWKPSTEGKTFRRMAYMQWIDDGGSLRERDD